MTESSKKRQLDAPLPTNQLENLLEEAIKAKGTAELAVLYLMATFKFNLKALKVILSENRVNFSLSNVVFEDIAPRVGLRGSQGLRDAATFEMRRARVTPEVFRGIIVDMDVITKQYGPPVDHSSVAARSRYLAPLFNRTVALFELMIQNSLESTIPGRFTTRSRIVSYFRTFGRISILFLEVKLQIGSAEERLDAIAQAIAERSACEFINVGHGFPSAPIYAIFCDGRSFEFFRFDRSTRPPTFKRGLLPRPNGTPLYSLAIVDPSSHGVPDFIQSLRPICETIFYFLLLGYQGGLRGGLIHTMARSDRDRAPGESDLGWLEALRLAEVALETAVQAAQTAADNDIDGANASAEKALEKLRGSLSAVPASFHRGDCQILDAFDAQRANAA